MYSMFKDNRHGKMKFYTPLRYPGGKGKLSPFIRLLFEQNALVGEQYAELYAGGAGVAINLLMNSVVSHIHLNDLNYSVYAFWNSIVTKPDELCRLINDTKVTMDEWHRQKYIMSNPEQFSTLEIGFSTFFLNRTNRSGILLGGVIGGKEQLGNWKLDARFNKKNLLSRIDGIAKKADNISVYNLDTKVFLKDIYGRLPEKTFAYLDPPYYVKGKGLYQNHYTHDDHVEIAELIKKLDNKYWMVSYDNTPEINLMYSSLRKLEYGINYSAQERYKGPEIIFFSKKMKVPDVINPMKLESV